jgi:hypothetical protein
MTPWIALASFLFGGGIVVAILSFVWRSGGEYRELRDLLTRVTKLESQVEILEAAFVSMSAIEQRLGHLDKQYMAITQTLNSISRELHRVSETVAVLQAQVSSIKMRAVRPPT